MSWGRGRNALGCFLWHKVLFRPFPTPSQGGLDGPLGHTNLACRLCPRPRAFGHAVGSRTCFWTRPRTRPHLSRLLSEEKRLPRHTPMGSVAAGPHLVLFGRAGSGLGCKARRNLLSCRYPNSMRMRPLRRPQFSGPPSPRWRGTHLRRSGLGLCYPTDAPDDSAGRKFEGFIPIAFSFSFAR